MTEEAKIVLTAEDEATPALEKMKRGAKRTLTSVASSAKRAASAFKAVGVAAALANQALELGKKAWELFRLAVVDTVAVAGEFRQANDRAIGQLRDFAKAAEVLRARIGDALIPVLQGFAAGLTPVADGMTQWLSAHRKLIGLRMVDFLERVSTILASGVARGIALVVKAWAGWGEIASVVDLALSKFFQLALEHIDLTISGLETVAGLFGENGLTRAIASARVELRGMASNFEDGADSARKNFGAATAKAQTLLNKINEVETALRVGIATGAEAGRIAVGNSVEGMKTKLAELTAAREAHQAAVDDWMAEEIANAEFWAREEGRIERERLDAILKMQDERAAKERQLAEQRRAEMEATAQQATAQVLGLLNAAADGEEAFQEALVGALEQTAEQLIQMAVQRAVAGVTANAAEGASAAAAANAGIPGVGVGVAAAASAAMFALILGFKDKILNFNQGGVVPGIGNRDSVPAMLTPGEIVIPKGQAAGTSSRTVNLQVNLQSSAPPTNQAEFRRQVRDVIAPELVRLIKNRQVVLPT